jgi:hypothetical protein
MSTKKEIAAFSVPMLISRALQSKERKRATVPRFDRVPKAEIYSNKSVRDYHDEHPKSLHARI